MARCCPASRHTASSSTRCARFSTSRPVKVFTADRLFGETAWRAHDFYRQYLQPLDLRYILGANLRGERGVECAFFVSRAHGGRDFDAAERAQVATLLPHLQRAVELHAAFDVLDAERALYAGTVDRLDVGTAIVDEDGRVIKRNRIAERLIEQQDGLCVRQSGSTHRARSTNAGCRRRCRPRSSISVRARLRASKPPRCRAPAARCR